MAPLSTTAQKRCSFAEELVSPNEPHSPLSLTGLSFSDTGSEGERGNHHGKILAKYEEFLSAHKPPEGGRCYLVPNGEAEQLLLRRLIVIHDGEPGASFELRDPNTPNHCITDSWRIEDITQMRIGLSKGAEGRGLSTSRCLIVECHGNETAASTERCLYFDTTSFRNRCAIGIRILQRLGPKKIETPDPREQTPSSTRANWSPENTPAPLSQQEPMSEERS